MRNILDKQGFKLRASGLERLEFRLGSGVQVFGLEGLGVAVRRGLDGLELGVSSG